MAFCQIICEKKDLGARIQKKNTEPGYSMNCIDAMSLVLCGKAKRSLRLIAAEKMIMIQANTVFIEGNHAYL